MPTHETPLAELVQPAEAANTSTPASLRSRDFKVILFQETALSEASPGRDGSASTCSRRKTTCFSNLAGEKKETGVWRQPAPGHPGTWGEPTGDPSRVHHAWVQRGARGMREQGQHALAVTTSPPRGQPVLVPRGASPAFGLRRRGGGCSVSVWEGDAAPCPVPHSWGREDRNWAERVGLGSGPAEGAAGTGHPHGPHRAGEGQEERTLHGPHKALAGVWEPNPTDPTGPTEPCSWRMHPTRTPYTLHGPFHPTWAHCTPHGPLPPYMGPTHAEWATHTPHGPHTSPMGPTQPTWTPYTPHGLHTPPMGPTQPTRALHTPHGPHTPHMSPTQAPQSPGGFWEPMLHDPTEPWGVHRPHTAPIVVVLGNPPYTGPTAPSGP